MLDATRLDQLGISEVPDHVLQFVSDLYENIDDTTADSCCDNCKKCCDFGEFGHRLFVTSVELLHFVSNVDQIKKPEASVCPYLDAEGGCTVRDIRPVGCRTFFCKPADDTLTERTLSDIKIFLDTDRFPYYYIEWLHALHCLADGRRAKELQPDRRQ